MFWAIYRFRPDRMNLYKNTVRFAHRRFLHVVLSLTSKSVPPAMNRPSGKSSCIAHTSSNVLGNHRMRSLYILLAINSGTLYQWFLQHAPNLA